MTRVLLLLVRLSSAVQQVSSIQLLEATSTLPRAMCLDHSWIDCGSCFFFYFQLTLVSVSLCRMKVSTHHSPSIATASLCFVLLTITRFSAFSLLLALSLSLTAAVRLGLPCASRSPMAALEPSQQVFN